jgi:hypothetical protein
LLRVKKEAILPNRYSADLGETPFRWGEYRNIPGYEDYIYWVWRWMDCCLR